jgi:hypothetical protein
VRLSSSATRPNLVIHDFWPFVSIARRLLDPLVPAIAFLPIPLDLDMVGGRLPTDEPDFLTPLTYLPLSLHRVLVRALPEALKFRAPTLRQRNIQMKVYSSCVVVSFLHPPHCGGMVVITVGWIVPRSSFPHPQTVLPSHRSFSLEFCHARENLIEYGGRRCAMI